MVLLYAKSILNLKFKVLVKSLGHYDLGKDVGFLGLYYFHHD